MGECKLDHNVEDVQKKLAEQAEYLPESIVIEFQSFLEQDLSQETLNEAFHLLKKFDLSSKEEQETRTNKMNQMFNKS